MTSAGSLDEVDCWQVSGVTSAEKFFGAIPLLLPDATHVFLEGAPDPDVVALLSAHAERLDYRAPVGTIWSWPQSNRRFSLRASSSLFTALAKAGNHHAEPEICCHIHVYRDDEPLLQPFDAFTDPLLVSKGVPRERVEQFCSDAGGAVSDGAA